MSCDYSLSSSLFFSSFYILHALASPSLLHFLPSSSFSLSPSSRSNVLRQYKTRSFRDDVYSRSIDFNLNWLFNIPACSNWVYIQYIDAYLEIIVYENLNGIRITVCAYWRFNRTRPLFAVDYTRDTYTCSCACKPQYTNTMAIQRIALRDSCRRVKKSQMENGIRELNYYRDK